MHIFQGVPESQRADAVESMVYEANARIRDPVYGCAGAICQLQKQIIELQTELAKAEVQILNMKSHKMINPTENLQYQENIIQQQPFDNSSSFFFDANNEGLDSWEPFWK
ncbi:LOB domain-containing protein 1 [Abeliophyllum distichum]|uniref:LOB domain-containing protein 1 n=1 Tax=Abeliophyllum distichum TaxID=126358 RepID=A0ABD1P4H3_9LAMI